MRSLILFFARYGAILLFILLEFICLSLVVNYNDSQREIFLNSTNVFTAYFHQKGDNFSNYLNLAETSRNLARENAQLKTRQQKAFFNHTINVDTFDVAQNEQQYVFIEAKVVNNSITSRTNYLTINKGRDHGLKAGMGVVSANGLVGVIKQCSDNYSVCISLLNSQMRVSAKVKRTRAFGSLRWKSSDPTRMDLDDIPKHVEVVRGDTVVTSGYSTIFPIGLQIGVVDKIKLSPGSNNYSMDIKLGNDISSLEYVYVIQNLMKTEQEALEKHFSNE